MSKITTPELPSHELPPWIVRYAGIYLDGSLVGTAAETFNRAGNGDKHWALAVPAGSVDPIFFKSLSDVITYVQKENASEQAAIE